LFESIYCKHLPGGNLSPTTASTHCWASASWLASRLPATYDQKRRLCLKGDAINLERQTCWIEHSFPGMCHAKIYVIQLHFSKQVKKYANMLRLYLSLSLSPALSLQRDNGERESGTTKEWVRERESESERTGQPVSGRAREEESESVRGTTGPRSHALSRPLSRSHTLSYSLLLSFSLFHYPALLNRYLYGTAPLKHSTIEKKSRHRTPLCFCLERQTSLWNTSSWRGIGKSFQLAIIAPQ